MNRVALGVVIVIAVVGIFLLRERAGREGSGRSVLRSDASAGAPDETFVPARKTAEVKPPGPRPVAPPAPETGDTSKPTLADQEKLHTLDAILASRNDNDPRLDMNFNELSKGAKALFRDRYRKIPAEGRNERGTVVFLLGRNLQSPADVSFLGQVVAEPACLSLADCRRELAVEKHSHWENGTEVTLAYPQVVALKSFETYLARTDRDPVVAAAAYAQLRSAAQSPVPVVARLADDILSRTPNQ